MSTAMVNSRDKTMGSTGGRRANASMTEKLALQFTEIAVEGGQNSGSMEGIQHGLVVRVVVCWQPETRTTVTDSTAREFATRFYDEVDLSVLAPGHRACQGLCDGLC
jgi:hypothetical protein